jgi:hypothetical protein
MNSRSIILKVTAVGLALFVMIAGTALAQSMPTTIGGIDISVNVRNPSPGQNVTVKAVSYSFDINSATIAWTANGKTLAKGIGVTSVVVPAPALGKLLTINVSATAVNGSIISNSYTISSGSVDMIIEPDGYVPPLFLGKVPVAYQNSVKIAAIAHIANSAGVEYNPSSLIYSWKQDTTALQSQSGYGKQSIVVQGSLVPRPYLIDVTVTTRDGSLATEGLISVSTDAPSVTFYKDDPLYGPLLNLALGGSAYIGNQQEMGVLAVPYGFNLPETGTDGSSFTWSINGTEHPELAGHQSVVLRAPAGTAGSSNVQLTVTGTQNILQQASAAFSAIFNNSASSTQPSVKF